MEIVKTIGLKAPIGRVWQALTDFRQFGAWFGVKLDGPFQLGETASGYITHPGYEHVRWNVVVTKIEFERLFAFTWHPYAIDPSVDYSKEKPTSCEFSLEPVQDGTRLTIRESGFENVPAERRALAYRMNDGGWQAQIKNIEAFLA
jgi:uncharacterized protein YndB with AHSA1/START domain